MFIKEKWPDCFQFYSCKISSAQRIFEEKKKQSDFFHAMLATKMLAEQSVIQLVTFKGQHKIVLDSVVESQIPRH
jgi:hypothetical protein